MSKGVCEELRDISSDLDLASTSPRITRSSGIQICESFYSGKAFFDDRPESDAPDRDHEEDETNDEDHVSIVVVYC